MMGLDDLDPDDQADARRMIADLFKRGYVTRKRFNELTAGVRVRHHGHRWPRAYDEGSGVIVAITEKNPSAWSHSWGAPDIEMVVAWDQASFGSRLSLVAQYHVHLVARVSAPYAGGGDRD